MPSFSGILGLIRDRSAHPSKAKKWRPHNDEMRTLTKLSALSQRLIVTPWGNSSKVPRDQDLSDRNNTQKGEVPPLYRVPGFPSSACGEEGGVFMRLRLTDIAMVSA